LAVVLAAMLLPHNASAHLPKLAVEFRAVFLGGGLSAMLRGLRPRSRSTFASWGVGGWFWLLGHAQGGCTFSS
jgi:hypothetical protein